MPTLSIGKELESLIAYWKTNRESVSTCESCTGGYIASQLTLHAGSSIWYQGGIISYQIELKEQLVNVPRTTIEQYGVVSVEVAEAMARGANILCNSTVSIATTGVAGPSGGTPEIPVGSVCIACDTPRGIYSTRLQLEGSRQEIIEQTYYQVINKLYLWELKQ